MKSVNFKRKEESYLRYFEEQSARKQKRPFNWDRFVYLVLLAIFLFFTGRFIINSYFYIEGNGQVLFESVDIRHTDDIRILKFHVKEGDDVSIGDTLFTYFLDEDVFGEAGGFGGNRVNISDGGSGNSWIEREIYTLRKNVDLNKVQVADNKKLLDIYYQDLERVRNEVILDAVSHTNLENLEYQINKLEAEINLLDEQIRIYRKQIGYLLDLLEKENMDPKKINVDQKSQYGGGSGGGDNGKEFETDDFVMLAGVENLDGYKIFTSPIDGSITNIEKMAFEVALKTETILSIHQPNNVHIKGFFDQQDLRYLSEGDIVNIEFADGTESQGYVDRFYAATYKLPEEFQKKFEPTTRTLAADILPLNPADLQRWKKYYKLSVRITKKNVLMPELKVNKEESTVEYAGFSFLLLTDLNLDVEKVGFHSAVIIDGHDRSFIRQIVRRIRSHNSPDIYLKPVFILKGINIIDPMVNKLVDGTLFSLEQIELIIPEVERILTKTGELHFTNSLSFEAQMIEKVISYMYTCEIQDLDPIPYIYSANNYYYPILSVNFNHKDEHMALDILEIAEREGVFDSSYVDKVYLCSGCQNGQLSYREVCPKCGSSHSTTEDIIHHFPCAYVGPLSDFTNEIDDQLDCPKCNKRLRHIGVDYDKPSVLHECKACDHKFQDFNVKAKCLACGQDSLVEQLKGREIRKYSLTKKGQIAAINGFVSTSKDIEEIIGTVKFDTFLTMLKYEIERLKQTEGASNICAIHLSNPSQLYSKMGSEVQKVLLKDLVKVIRSNIRTSDIISFQSSSTIVLSMNEIPTRIANKILTEIVEMLKRLIATSFKDISVEFEMEVVKLDYKLSPQLHIQQLTKNFG